MTKSLVQGAFYLTIATMLSKIIGSAFRIPLQNIAGNEVLGIFTLVYPVYMTVLILAVAGIPLAISKLISESRAIGEEENIRHIFITASLLALLFGCISFVGLLSSLDSLVVLLGGEYIRLSIIVISFSLLIAPYMAVYRGYFQGFDIMKATAVSQVIEQIVRVFFILLFAFFLVQQNQPSHIVTAGVMAGSIIGVFASFVYLRIYYTRVGPKPKEEPSQKYNWQAFKLWSKKILVLAIPICIGIITLALINLIDSLTVPTQLRAIGFDEETIPYIYGYYGRGLALVQIGVVFAQSMVIPLIPLITSALVKGEKEHTSSLTEKALSYTHLTSWPISIGLLALTIPINYAFFGDFRENAVIAILHFNALFTAFAIMTTGLLQGMNRSFHAALIVLGCAALKVILNIVFIRHFGLMGVAISTVIVYALMTIFNLVLIKNTITLKMWKRHHFIYGLSAIVMGIVVALPLYWLDLTEWTRGNTFVYLMGMILLGALIYGGMILALKGITSRELKQIPYIGKYISNGG
ncbi:O-antigen/teichoic acid export membrane protein [Evansella vedderi]|uniref:O-antigen/teichoic acid export membrane protein n=1 Tax=Evansella vedderi TaxID=38282 RepID=A0ABT9ZTE3_9BACI|nr:polysaccharide biosynthesis protein [Evansella vedderi]MDQ0254511.1 O-antigen/teichoic acid export membrane protein [Evansella vedderi]